MTLHQFIENILAHAYGCSDQKMVIQVTGIMYPDRWEICVRDNGEGIAAEKLEEIRERKPDLVICDIKMPLLSGLELASIVRDEFPEICFIIVIGYQENFDRGIIDELLHK